MLVIKWGVYFSWLSSREYLFHSVVVNFPLNYFSSLKLFIDVMVIIMIIKACSTDDDCDNCIDVDQKQ